MIMSFKREYKYAALAVANAGDDQFRGFGATEADAMRDAVESGRIAWDIEPGATWQEITADAKKAAIVDFASTPYGVLVLDRD